MKPAFEFDPSQQPNLLAEIVGGDRSIEFIESPSQFSDDDAARTLVRGCVDAFIDVEDEFRHVIVPIQVGHRLRRQPTALA